jgi:hypothetical protein
MLTILYGESSNAYSQNRNNLNQFNENKAASAGLYNQQEWLIPNEKQEFYNDPVRGRPSESRTNSLTVLYDSIYLWFWNASANEWKIKPFQRTTNIKYDKNYRKTSELVQGLWPYPDTWIDYMRYTYTYDSNNNLTGELSEKWNGTNGVWDNYHSNIFEYDLRNNRIRHLSQHMEVSSESSFQYFSTFDDNNNEITFLSQKWDGSWTDLYKYFFYFNENNNRISTVVEYYGGTSSLDSSKSFCYYDSNNNLLKELFLWRINQEWVNYNQNIFTYDINNNRTSNLFQKWDNNSWKNLSLNTCIYDINNNQISDLSQEWIGSAWRNNYIYKYTYDNNNIKKSTVFYYFNNDGSTFYSGDSTCNYFHVTSYGINEIETQLIKIYPNPASEFVYITINKSSNEIVEFNIYSITGVIVRSGIIDQNNQQINIEDLCNGIYLISTKSKKMTGIQKLVIQR